MSKTVRQPVNINDADRFLKALNPKLDYTPKAGDFILDQNGNMIVFEDGDLQCEVEIK